MWRGNRHRTVFMDEHLAYLNLNIIPSRSLLSRGIPSRSLLSKGKAAYILPSSRAG